MKNQGYPDDLFDGRPVIGIAQSHSDFNPCNGHFRELAEKIKAGVWEAGGFPLEFPAMSLGESLLRPTAMLFRNLMAMDVEESIRGYPMDGVVLLAGCDKTTPGPVMLRVIYSSFRFAAMSICCPHFRLALRCALTAFHLICPAVLVCMAWR
jgi:dihydroxyacid dehydratase/phosphogluconate dehydratase